MHAGGGAHEATHPARDILCATGRPRRGVLQRESADDSGVGAFTSTHELLYTLEAMRLRAREVFVRARVCGRGLRGW